MDARRQRVAVLAGASGFIGSALVEAFVQDGYEIRFIGRSGPIRWGDTTAIASAVDGADVVVNLAGKSVSCRYTDRNRDEILASRVDTTHELRVAIAHAARPPRVWLNASTATIYRHSMDRANTEGDGEIGTGFSVDVATEWERELFAGDLPNTRRVALRMAIVLGDGPATDLLLNVARAGLGGTQFDGWCLPHRRYRGIGAHPSGGTRAPWYRTRGCQRFSWVHLDDVLRAIRFIRDDDRIDGPVNIASPNPSDNCTLMRTLRAIVGARVGLPTARWMLEIGMWVLRTEPELILKSRWVLPRVLTDAGFVFEYTDLRTALEPLWRDRTTSSAEGRARVA